MFITLGNNSYLSELCSSVCKKDYVWSVGSLFTYGTALLRKEAIFLIDYGGTYH